MTIHNAEQIRQHQAHAAIRARLMGKPTPFAKPAPVMMAEEPTKRFPVQQDYHVWLYRMHRMRYPVGLFTEKTFSFQPSTEYSPYEQAVTFSLKVPLKTMKEIAAEVLEDFPEITLEDLKGVRRDRRIARPRQIVMYQIARQRPDISYPSIGRFLGGRDHTGILHGVRKMRAEFENDPVGLEWIERKKKGGRKS